MFKTTLVALTFAAAFGSVSAAEKIDIPRPEPPSFELLSDFGTKANCMTENRVAGIITQAYRFFGGKVVFLSDGLDTAFADLWRDAVHEPHRSVKGVAAHGYPSSRDPNGILVNVFEFGEDGCTLTHTVLPSAVWNMLYYGAVMRTHPVPVQGKVI